MQFKQIIAELVDFFNFASMEYAKITLSLSITNAM